jgi:hypothetical protein
MPLPGFTESPMLPLRGAWRDMDQVQPDLVRGRAFEARNIRVKPGRVVTRDGHVTGLSVPGRTTSLYQWLPTLVGLGRKNFIFYHSNGKVWMKNMADSSAAVELFSATARGASYAEAANKLYVCTYDNDGLGVTGLKLANPLGTGQIVDNAFSPPLALVPTVAQTTASGAKVTPGTHLFGYLVEYRSGCITPYAPLVGGIFTPVSATITADKQVQLTVTFTTGSPAPADIAFLHAIMTRADNPSLYYIVPDGSIAVPPGVPITPATTWAATMNIAITDEDLSARAEAATPYMTKLTMTGSTPPVTPSQCLMYGDRLVLVAGTKAYASDQFDYEFMTEARHTVQLPGMQPIVAAGVQGGMIYWFGRNYTFASMDNGSDPRQWSKPERVSGAIGVTGPNCINFDNARSTGWVISRTGCWTFAGQYEEKPTTHLWRDDWVRINWAYAHTISVEDDIVNQRLYIATPMGAATEPDRLWVIDYSRGKAWSDVDITIDTFQGMAPGSVKRIEDSAAASTIWMAPTAAGTFWKQSPGALADDAAGIDCEYETGFILDFMNSMPSQCEMAYFDLSGAGVCEVTFKAKDAAITRALLPVFLQALPGQLTSRAVQCIAANGTLRFKTSNAGEWFELRSVSMDSKQFATSW